MLAAILQDFGQTVQKREAWQRSKDIRIVQSGGLKSKHVWASPSHYKITKVHQWGSYRQQHKKVQPETNLCQWQRLRSCNFCLASSSTSGFGTMFLLQLPITEDPRHPSGASTLRTQDLNLEGCSALVFCRVTKCRDIVSLLTLLPQCGIFTPKLMFLGELQKIFVFHKPSVS